MDAFGPIGKISATTGAAALALSGAGKKDEKDKQPKDTPPSAKEIAMAAKARKNAQLKINAIVQNRELSQKAMTRRIGKVLDEYKGGKK